MSQLPVGDYFIAARRAGWWVCGFLFALIVAPAVVFALWLGVDWLIAKIKWVLEP